MMSEEFRLKVFLAVAKTGSFTDAAAELDITQPAVSQHIIELEKDSGRKLFERTRKGTVLTPEGEVMLAYAQKIMKGYSSVSVLFSQSPETQLTMSVSDQTYSLFLQSAMDIFLKIHPEVKLVRTTDVETADVVMRLEKSSALAPSDNALVRIRAACSPVSQLDGFPAIRESVRYLDLLFIPSSSFGHNPLCAQLRAFLLDFAFGF